METTALLNNNTLIVLHKYYTPREEIKMIVTCVLVNVKPDFIEDFIEATTENHLHSVQEPGNMRFDVLQNKTDPSRFTLYEAYESEEPAAAHKTTKHYLKWRKKVAGWMAKPREGIHHDVICPLDRTKW